MDKNNKGAFGWPLVPSKAFPDEQTLGCPACGSISIRLGVHYPACGSGPGGQGRAGDYGSSDYIHCEACGKHESKRSE